MIVKNVVNANIICTMFTEQNKKYPRRKQLDSGQGLYHFITDELMILSGGLEKWKIKILK